MRRCCGLPSSACRSLSTTTGARKSGAQAKTKAWKSIPRADLLPTKNASEPGSHPIRISATWWTKARDPLQTYDDLEAQYGHDEAMRRVKEAMEKERADYDRACMEWQPHYERATEYAASQIFLALRDGRLQASGRLIPSPNLGETIAALKAEERYGRGLPLTEIPRAFWSLKSIHFDISAAQNSETSYCHVVLRTDQLLEAFPGHRRPISAEKIGDTIVLNETAPSTSQPRTSRGRPSYPWERFHLEVSALLQRNELPAKKEAAIQHFQSWFERELSIRPSRAAIGKKLTPYYDRFVRGGGHKADSICIQRPCPS